MTDKEITDIIKMDANGLQVLDYKEIVDVLLDRYRQIFGYNIDLDVRTADARLIFDNATIINTLCNVIKSMYNSLNPNTAQGTFLDVLSSLTNVIRKDATKSVASIVLTLNTITSTINLTSDNFDKIKSLISSDSGVIWTLKNDDLTSITLNEDNPSITLLYENSEEGAISSTGFEWLELNEITNLLNITLKNLSLGSESETDIELRERRVNSSNNGLTIDESLRGRLMSLTGIKDAWIQSYAQNPNENQYFNYKVGNNKSHSIKQSPFSVAILLKRDSVNSASDNAIGSVIRNYLTAGVLTKQDLKDITEVEEDERGEKVFEYFNSSTSLTSNYFWYEPKATTDYSYVSILLYYTYQFKDEMAQTIIEKLFYYLNNLRISQTFYDYQLVQVVQNAIDNSSQYYSVASVKIGDNIVSPNINNKGNYFDFHLDLAKYEIKIDRNESSKTLSIYLEEKA